MKASGRCPKCSSQRIVSGVSILDRDQSGENELTIRVEKSPGATLFRDFKDYRLKACICGNCGHTELYLENAERFWEETRPS